MKLMELRLKIILFFRRSLTLCLLTRKDTLRKSLRYTCATSFHSLCKCYGTRTLLIAMKWKGKSSTFGEMMKVWLSFAMLFAWLLQRSSLDSRLFRSLSSSQSISKRKELIMRFYGSSYSWPISSSNWTPRKCLSHCMIIFKFSKQGQMRIHQLLWLSSKVGWQFLFC